MCRSMLSGTRLNCKNILTNIKKRGRNGENGLIWEIVKHLMEPAAVYYVTGVIQKFSKVLQKFNCPAASDFPPYSAKEISRRKKDAPS